MHFTYALRQCFDFIEIYKCHFRYIFLFKRRQLEFVVKALLAKCSRLKWPQLSCPVAAGELTFSPQ